MTGRSALALVAAAMACTGTNDEVAFPRPGDVEAYARDVHPILEARCATLDCHGDPRRPLRLYAETGLRAADELRGTSLTLAELLDNARSLSAVDPDSDPSDSLVLTKPLRARVDHEGGDQWRDATDPQPTCVLGWLAGLSPTSATLAACAEARPEVALPPP
jgi:hypothetical protein